MEVKSPVVCDTCKHKEYCPREPKTFIECDMYKVDIELSYRRRNDHRD